MKKTVLSPCRGSDDYDVESLSKALQWIILPSNWSALGQTFSKAAQKKLALAMFLGFGVFILFLLRRRLRNGIEAAGKSAEMGSCRTFAPTITSFVNTLLIAALWPAILLSIGWLMLNASGLPFVQAASKSLIFVAITIYPFEVLKQTCRTLGLRWNSELPTGQILNTCSRSSWMSLNQIRRCLPNPCPPWSSKLSELYREMIGGLLNTYLTSVANKTNEVMKVLTIVATIFIPLTFLAGIYGMNFEHMPELKWKWAYPTFWLTIVATGVLMVGLFWRNGWIKFGRPENPDIDV